MLIRKADAEKMRKLWGNDDSFTARFFYDRIASGNAVFWTVDDDGKLIGELYAFLNLDDQDFADGKDRVYLCAFRIRRQYRGQGLGTRLMEQALSDLKDRGFITVTIGVNKNEPENIRLYERLGFREKVKECHYDPCGLDEKGQPEYDEESWWLLARQF